MRMVAKKNGGEVPVATGRGPQKTGRDPLKNREGSP
jgi:hypothetical protein